MRELVVALLVAANGPGKTLVRTQMGTVVPTASVGRNYIANSDNLVTGTGWATAGTCTLTANQGPAGYADMDGLRCTGANSDSRYSSATVPSSTGPFVISVEVASDSGSKVETVAMYAGGATLSSCACGRADSGACMVGGNASAAPYAYGTFTTAPVRMWLTCSAATARTTINVSAHDGQMGSTFNVGGLFGRAQVEIGSRPTPYRPRL